MPTQCVNSQIRRPPHMSLCPVQVPLLACSQHSQNAVPLHVPSFLPTRCWLLALHGPSPCSQIVVSLRGLYSGFGIFIYPMVLLL